MTAGEVQANGNATLTLGHIGCESCDERGVLAVKFNSAGIGLKFSACAVCLNEALKLIRAAAEPVACEHPDMRFCLCEEPDCGGFYCPDCQASGLKRTT